MSSNPLTEANGVLIDRLYNFGDSSEGFTSTSAVGGKTKNKIDTDLICSGNTGGIWVNINDRIAFVDIIENPINSNPSNFNLYISGDIDCTDDDEKISVEFNTGAKFLIGEWSAGVQNSANVYIQDKADVLIGANSSSEVRHNSSLVVEKGGTLTVNENGELIAKFGGEIIVQAGATLTIKTGATLRLSQYSKLKIQDGGRLIIENNANIQLWDGSLADGRAVIEVNGTLQVDDEFNFTGNGYFSFFPSNILELPSGHFIFEGVGPDYRFIQLEENAHLDLGSNLLELRDGKIVYEDYSSIVLGDAGQLTLANTKHKGSSSATGLTADGISRLLVSNSVFEDLSMGMEIYNFPKPSSHVHSLINGTSFTNCETGLQVDHSGQIYLLNSIFNGGTHAMLFNKLNSARLQYCDVSNYTDPNPAVEDHWGAIEINDVPELIVSGGHIHNNGVGIFAPEWNEDGGLNQSNIVLRNQAVVSDHNEYGIFMAKGGTDGNGMDYGLVLMDCAQLLDNTVGIGGRDVLLQIDALENSGTDDSQYWRSNSFRNPINGKLFDICYSDRADVFEVSAQGNYWFDTNIANNIQSLHLLKNAHLSSGCAGYYPSVTVDVSNFVLQQNATCPIMPSVPQNPPTGTICNLITSGSTQLGQSVELGGSIVNYSSTSSYYHDAYVGYLNAIDADESTETAKDAFVDLAGVEEAYRFQASVKCQKYVDVARILAVKSYEEPAINALQDLGIGNASINKPFRTEKLATSFFHVYPNPTSDVFWVESNTPQGYIELVNSLGQNLQTILFENESVRLNMNGKESGIYYLKWKTKNGALIKTERIVLLK